MGLPYGCQCDNQNGRGAANATGHTAKGLAMNSEFLPSPENLRKMLRYEADTGNLYWLPREEHLFASVRSFKTWNSRFSGKLAIHCINRRGYRSGDLCAVPVYAHRVIWAMQFGKWPEMFIDHINGVRADNRIENLRQTDRDGNAKNARIRSDNTSGHKGVSWNKWHKKWTAQIFVHGQNKHLGHYTEKEDAVKVVMEARQKWHGEFARHS